MKTSCKYIDIKDPQTIRPYVEECVRRHIGRHDFEKLLRSVGVSKDIYERAKAGEKHLLAPAIDKLSEWAAEATAERNLGLSPVRIDRKVDVSTQKVRLIGKESAKQQIMDCIAVGAAQEIWDRRIVPQQASSLPGRGQMYGTGIISRWVTADNRAAEYARKHGLKYSRKCRYHVKIDIVQFYKSLRKEHFMKWFERDCGNDDLVWLWEELLSSHRVEMEGGDMYEGFMIGARPSQTAAQYILSFIYRFAMDLHVERRGKKIKMVSHMLMFMDDMLLFSPSRRNLRAAVRLIAGYVREEFGLRLSGGWQIVRMEETPADMMGFLVHADGSITVRPRVFVRIRRLALKVIRRGGISFAQAKRACSYKGYFMPRRVQFKRFLDNLRYKKAARRLRLGYLFRIASRTVSMHERRHCYDYCIV